MLSVTGDLVRDRCRPARSGSPDRGSEARCSRCSGWCRKPGCPPRRRSPRPGASTQPRTISSGQLGSASSCGAGEPWPPAGFPAAAVTARRRSSSACSSGLSSRSAAADADSPPDVRHGLTSRRLTGPVRPSARAAASLVHARSRIHSPCRRITGLTSSASGELSRAVPAGPGSSPAFDLRCRPRLYGRQQEPRAHAQQREVAEHLEDENDSRGLGSWERCPRNPPSRRRSR